MSYELRVRHQESETSMKYAVSSRQIFYCLLLTAYFLLLFVGNSYAFTVTVNVADTSAVEGDIIYLKDIAEISGDNKDFVNRLGDITIGYSPLPGESKAITKDLLKLCIKRERIAAEDIKLNSPQLINVSRIYFEFTPQQLKEAIEDFVGNRNDISKGRIIVDNVAYRGKIILPSPDFSYEIKSGPLNSSGRKFFNIVFKTDGNILKSLDVAVDLKIMMPVVVAVNQIKKGEAISEKDIQIEDREIGRDASQIVTDSRDIPGKQAKVDIVKGEVITIDSAETMTLVNQGDVVNIVAESNMIRVTVKGVVKDKGRKGELVKVLNLSSNKIIHAKIIDSNTVRVEF